MTVIVWLRVGVRFVSLSALTLIIFQVWLVGLPFTIKSPRNRVRWRNANFRGWSKAALKVIGARVSVEGVPPQPPFLLVSNHLSYVDVALLGSRLDAVFIAKADVAGWPIFGFLCRCFTTIFVDREASKQIPRVLEQMDAVLTDGRGLVLFPEGTSSRGSEVQPFHSSLLAHAASDGFPVSYVALSYHTPPGEVPADVAVCWWGDATFLGHMRHLLALRRFHASVAFGEEPICDRERKRLAASLHAAVASKFVPVGERRSYAPQGGRTESAVARAGERAAAQARRR